VALIKCTECHDAVWLMAPLDELDATVQRVREFMQLASIAVTDGHAARTKVEWVIRSPKNKPRRCLGDIRSSNPNSPVYSKGAAMWEQVNALIDSGQLRRAG
jgi:hypothetical protein